MSVALLSLLLFGTLASLGIGGSTDEDAADDPLTEPDELDLGATITESTDGETVSVELGEGETGSLLYVNYTDTEDLGTGAGEYLQARLYLVPEGVELTEINGGDGTMRTLDDMAEDLGFKLLGSWEQGSVLQLADGVTVTNINPSPVVVSDSPIEVIDVEANTDGDDVVTLQEADQARVSTLDLTLTEEEDGTLTVELGPDQDGSVVAVLHESNYRLHGYGARGYEVALQLYHVPEGVTFPDNLDAVPDDVDNGWVEEFFPGEVTLGHLAQHYGMTSLGNWDLGGYVANYVDEEFEDTRIAAPLIVTDVDVQSVYVSDASYDEAPVIAAITPIDNPQDTPFDLPLAGTDGDDTLVGGHLIRTDGGAGEDLIQLDRGGLVLGGEGNDTIDIAGSALIRGGAGDDVIRAEFNGGRPDDFRGGAGDDYIVVNEGGFALGEAGDDTLTASTTEANDGFVYPGLSGGEGADSFQVLTAGPLPDSSPATPFLLARIYGFDPAEDVLVVDTSLGIPQSATFADEYLTLGYTGDTTLQVYLPGLANLDTTQILYRDVVGEVEAAFA